MSPDTRLEPGMIVQLSPECRNPAFAGCFMQITEPKGWGAQGFVQALGTREAPGGRAYYRARWEEMELCGRAVWTPADEDARATGAAT